MALGSALVYFALQLVQDSEFTLMDSDMYYHFVVNGVFLLLSYPLMYIIEKAFGFVSSVTLFELSNTNRGILRNLSEVAPGTFQHSITVGNLAAEIANKIGANSLLVRTGALYHDIGKTLNPAFFTENQTGVNPHDELSEERSAQIIINHVTDGLKLAEKYHLPKVIRDFISTHHGRSQVKYFYIQWKNKHQGEEPDPALFTYPGPNPFTREQAILMMCDAVEASSRSLKVKRERMCGTCKGLLYSAPKEIGAAGLWCLWSGFRVEFGISNACVVNGLQTFCHHTFGISYIAEGNGTFAEIACLHLSINNAVYYI